MKELNGAASAVGLFSRDAKLVIALDSVLSPEFSVTHCQSAADHDARFDAVLLDIDSLGSRSQELEHLFTSMLASGVVVIVLAGDDNRADAARFVKRGAHGHIRTPPVVPSLKTLLRNTIENRKLRTALEDANQKLETITCLDQMIGSSAPMLALHGLIRKVANLDASVLITGESGTGKELMARAIHNLGKRSKRPFLAVSCAAIPESLIESELFGHEKGAFTGSAGTREGYFEQVGDGTLFLDEIGELKLSTQVKLLRVLQERQFSRLGSGRAIPLRARVVLATHRDLTRMVADGDFRQDLYYRISVMDIKAPALRHRVSDIPMLADHFLRKYSEIFGTPVERIAPDAIALLENYTWPGNIRELENVIQRALIVAEGYSIEANDLPDAIREAQIVDSEFEVQPDGSFECLVRAYKTKLAINAVRENGGNKTLASQSLSISRAYLHRLIRQDLPETDDEMLQPLKPDFESAPAASSLVC